MVLGSICGVSDGSRNSVGLEMLRTCRLRKCDGWLLPSGRNGERYEARRQSGVATTQRKGCGYRGAGQALMQLRGRLFGGDEQAVCRRAIFALYLFGVALIVKTLVQGE